MAFNPQGAKEVPISVFGGLCTEQIGQTLPDGVSPDNQDVEYIPGSVYSRRGLQKELATGFPAGPPFFLVPTVTYAKSYVDPLGVIRNLYLDSNGALWVEDVTTSPGVISLLGNFSPGSYAKSSTAFGREYIAINDTLHGSDIPLQYDGSNLDRVTQDGPGGAPTVTSLSLPSVAMAGAGGSPIVLTIAGIYPDQDVGGNWQVLNIYVTSGWGTIPAGTAVVVSGGTPFDGTYTVQLDPGPGLAITVSCSIASSTPPYIGTGTLTATTSAGVTMTRGNNTVTVTTAADHMLQVGYRAQISGVTASVVGTNISSVVINNTDAPGIATITTSAAHGLVPGLFVSLAGIAGVTVGTSISSATWSANVLTVTTSAAHGLVPGASVTITGSGGWVSYTAIVQAVNSSTVFTLPMVEASTPTGTASTVTLNWPIPETTNPTYFEVIAAPTSTKFQVQISYSDGTWTSGLVYFAWDGTFYVTNVVDSTTFQYQQYGPNATSSSVGTVTPYGQIAPGEHQCQVLFQTRNGAITKPSPPAKFIANGGQYVSISNLPIGPDNVTARILAFTGAKGAYFFYIPTIPQVNGQVVGTATQINDNTTTSVLLDFSDNTLFAGLGISIPGNNLAAQIVLDGALGFGYYGSRLITWGQRNRIQNLLNLGFDGGYFPNQPDIPAGWTSDGSGGALADGHFGTGWQIPVAPGNTGLLFQPAFEDAYGAPILTGNTQYKLRVWLRPEFATFDLNFNVWINSPSTSFTAKAIISGGNMSPFGSFLEANFDALTPAEIPSDMQILLFAQAAAGFYNLLVDEISIIYAENPYTDTVMFGSYVNNPEGFDGLTGKLGSTQDTRKIMDIGIVRQTMYFLTLDPSGRLHQTADNGVTEPAGWQISQVAANCGLLSAFSLTKSQADDSSAAGGEEWLAWASQSGPRIFGGDQPLKIAQEIQPNWTSDFKRGFGGINFAAQLTVWALNDPVRRQIYFGIPSRDQLRFLSMSAPNLILVMSYRELETAGQIAASGPIHTSMAGRLIATDHTRKWTRWNLTMNGASMMYRNASRPTEVVLWGGNGISPAGQAGVAPFITVNNAAVSYDHDILVNSAFVSSDGLIEVNGA